MSNDHDPYFGAFSQQGQGPGGPPSQRGPEDPAPRPPAGHHQPPPYPGETDAPEGYTGNYPPPPPAQAGYYSPGSPSASRRHDTVGAGLVPVRATKPHSDDAVALDHADVKRMKLPAEHGWRHFLHKRLGINLGPGKYEREEIALIARAQRTVRTTFPVAVLNLKGGVGKTVVTEALGSTFGVVRGGHVIAVDLDNDSGNLIERHGRENELSIIDLVSDQSVGRYLDVRAHTSENKSRLEVLSQPRFARYPRNVEAKDFDKALGILQEYYSIVLLDCGTALKSELMTSVLRASRALLIVTSASIDGLRETDHTLDWLRNNGHSKLLDAVLLVINHNDQGKPNVVIPKVVEQFSRKIDLERIFILPFDRHIHEGREITLKLLSKKSRRGYLELAATLSDFFPRTVD